MPFQFSDPTPYRYKAGDIFLGVDDHGHEIGIQTERHAICIAGARSGKGAALLIPNLLRWPENTLTIDPKGENCERTYQARQAMGFPVVALDPFHIANIPASIRGGFNPLHGLTPATRRVREKIMVLADGMVVSYDPKHTDWVEGTRTIIAGIIAYNVEKAPAEHRNLNLVRQTLMQSNEALTADAEEMMTCTGCGGLAAAAGVSILTALSSTKGIERDCLNKAREVTKWLDSEEIKAMLSASTFSMDDLKHGKISLFLILSPDDIEHYAMFFRLFVRSAISTMLEGGSGKGNHCLFLLDEFFSLGKLDIVAKSAGLMPSYGVHLFPFLQDLGQLQTLYGAMGAETFFGNADAHIFFGNSDPLTLKFTSERLGRLEPNEIASPPPVTFHETRHFKRHRDEGLFEDERTARERFEAEQRNEAELVKARQAATNADYSHALRRAGSPRFSPSEVAAFVAKSHGDKVARSMIVFGKGGDVLNLRLAPYFMFKSPAAVFEAEKPDDRIKYEELSDEERHSWRLYWHMPINQILTNLVKKQLLFYLEKYQHVHAFIVFLQIVILGLILFPPSPNQPVSWWNLILLPVYVSGWIIVETIRSIFDIFVGRHQTAKFRG